MTTGAGGNPAGCPAAKPPALQSCNFDLNAYCTYPGATCACRINGAPTSWFCMTCPDFEPANGSACTLPSATGTFSCPYGSDSCTCQGGSGWNCRCNGCP